MFIRATFIALLLHGALLVVAEPLISSDASEAQAVVDEKCALATRQRALEAKADEAAEPEQTRNGPPRSPPNLRTNRGRQNHQLASPAYLEFSSLVLKKYHMRAYGTKCGVLYRSRLLVR